MNRRRPVPTSAEVLDVVHQHYNGAESSGDLTKHAVWFEMAANTVQRQLATTSQRARTWLKQAATEPDSTLMWIHTDGTGRVTIKAATAQASGDASAIYWEGGLGLLTPGRYPTDLAVVLDATGRQVLPGGPPDRPGVTRDGDWIIRRDLLARMADRAAELHDATRHLTEQAAPADGPTTPLTCQARRLLLRLSQFGPGYLIPDVHYSHLYCADPERVVNQDWAPVANIDPAELADLIGHGLIALQRAPGFDLPSPLVDAVTAHGHRLAGTAFRIGLRRAVPDCLDCPFTPLSENFTATPALCHTKLTGA